MKTLLAVLLLAVVLTAGCTQYAPPPGNSASQTPTVQADSALQSELNQLDATDAGQLEDELLTGI